MERGKMGGMPPEAKHGALLTANTLKGAGDDYLKIISKNRSGLHDGAEIVLIAFAGAYTTMTNIEF